MSLYQAAVDVIAAHERLRDFQEEVNKARRAAHEAELAFQRHLTDDYEASVFVVQASGLLWLIEIDEENGMPCRIEALEMLRDPKKKDQP